MKHTPGSWETTPVGNRKTPFQITGKDNIGCVIADIHANIYDERLDKQEAKANARLIACAPELLETVIKAMGLIAMVRCAYPITISSKRIYDEAFNLEDTIRKAIKKTEAK